MMKTIAIISSILFLALILIMFVTPGYTPTDIDPTTEQATPTIPDQEEGTATQLSAKDKQEFVNCLAERSTVVYGSATCPACRSFIDKLGGYEIAEPIYVECTNEGERCNQEMQTNYVPEIQVNGEVVENGSNLEVLAERTQCQLPL
jgi:hypothetical protein